MCFLLNNKFSMHKPIHYGAQSIDESDIEAVKDVLKSNFLTQGPKVEEFEKALADYCGVKEAVVFNNGTTALHAMYMACADGRTEVLVPAMTFAATANAAIFAGLKPVFLDCDENGHIILDDSLVNKNTLAVVSMDYAGHPVDFDKISEFARRHNIHFFDDSCHGLGGSYNGRKIGGIADMNVFSFHPVKSITTGEGGAILTNDSDWAKYIRKFRQHGMTKEQNKFMNESEGPWYHEMQSLGHNFRLTDIQCALGISQLKRIDEFISKRRFIAEKYSKAFEGNSYFDIPNIREVSEPAWHLYSIRLKENLLRRKKEIFEKMAERSIYLQVHYIPVYLHPYYASLGYKKGLCPGAEKFYESEISLPIYPDLSEEDQDYIMTSLMEILQNL